MLQVVFIESDSLRQLERDVNSELGSLKNRYRTGVDVKFETSEEKCIAMITYEN